MYCIYDKVSDKFVKRTYSSFDLTLRPMQFYDSLVEVTEALFVILEKEKKAREYNKEHLANAREMLIKSTLKFEKLSEGQKLFQVNRDNVDQYNRLTENLVKAERHMERCRNAVNNWTKDVERNINTDLVVVELKFEVK